MRIFPDRPLILTSFRYPFEASDQTRPSSISSSTFQTPIGPTFHERGAVSSFGALSVHRNFSCLKPDAGPSGFDPTGANSSFKGLFEDIIFRYRNNPHNDITPYAASYGRYRYQTHNPLARPGKFAQVIIVDLEDSYGATSTCVMRRNLKDPKIFYDITQSCPELREYFPGVLGFIENWTINEFVKGLELKPLQESLNNSEFRQKYVSHVADFLVNLSERHLILEDTLFFRGHNVIVNSQEAHFKIIEHGNLGLSDYKNSSEVLTFLLMDFLNSCRNDLELRCLFELLQKVFQKCDPTTLYCKPFRQTHHPLTRGYEDVFEKQKGIVLTEALYDRILLEHASSPQKHILYTSTILRGIKSPHTACFSTNFIEAIKNNNFDTFCELIKGNQYLGFIEDPEDPRYGFYESSTNPTEPYLMRRQEEVISRGAVPKIPPDYDSIEMGDLDPSSLTAEDFQNLPGTLWLHVNLKINYQPDIHTLDKQGESIVEGFLGEGLYLRSTPPPGKKTHEPYRLSRSRLLDLRLKNHQNPGLPLDVVERWEIFFNQHSSQLIEQPFHSRAVNHYREYLKNIKLYELTSLQDILRSHNGLSPLWVGLFSEFMRSEGFEGIVYDGPSGEEYALFNLEKAGPYDYWQRQRRKA